MVNVNVLSNDPDLLDSADKLASLFASYADYKLNLNKLPYLIKNLGLEDTATLRRAIIDSINSRTKDSDGEEPDYLVEQDF